MLSHTWLPVQKWAISRSLGKVRKTCHNFPSVPCCHDPRKSPLTFALQVLISNISFCSRSSQR